MYVIPSNKRKHVEKESLLQQQQQQELLADDLCIFLWEEDLGLKIKYKPSLVYEETDGELVLSRRTKVVVKYGTLTHIYIAEFADVFFLHDFLRILNKLSFTEPHTNMINNTWNWNQVWIRSRPVVLLDESFANMVIHMVRERISDINGELNNSLIFDGSGGGGRDISPLDVPLLHNTYNNSAAFFFECSSKRKQDTLLPVVIEHSGGIRVYPLTRDPTVLSFYTSVQVRDLVGSLEEAIEFIKERQRRFKLYTPISTLSPAIFATTTQATSSLTSIPPPILITNNATITTTSSTLLSMTEFSFKTTEEIVPYDYERVFTTDSSQHVWGVKEEPALPTDLMTIQNCGSICGGRHPNYKYIVVVSEAAAREHSPTLQYKGKSAIMVEDPRIFIRNDYSHSSSSSSPSSSLRYSFSDTRWAENLPAVISPTAAYGN